MLPIVRTIVYRTTLAALAVLLVALGVVQFQQHLLRHRAQRLHDEMVALQLHPGTFADVQRLAHEWGQFAHYDGECTQHHCIYTITFTDWSVDANWNQRFSFGPRSYKSYMLLGGRAAKVYATVRVRDDRMWGADFGLGVDVLHEQAPQAGDYGYMLAAEINSGSRLFANRPDLRMVDFKHEYIIGRPGGCMFCILGWVHMTPEASPSDIQRLSAINLDCITRYKPCLDLTDLIPGAWSEYLRNENTTESTQQDASCALPLEVFSREASNIVTVEVLKESERKPFSDEPASRETTMKIIGRLKNADKLTIGTDFDLTVWPWSIIPELGSAPALNKIHTGHRYIVFFRDRHKLLEKCGIVPLTDTALLAVQHGVIMDPSTGEPYSWEDEDR